MCVGESAMAVVVRAGLLFVALLAGAAAAPAEDAVVSLPGFGAPPARQWSGYLKGQGLGTRLHYWAADCEKQPAEECPVVLWLNGGPGSSSVLGLLQEHGPLLLNATGGLMRNPYRWTREAFLVVLESPAGVGYSYCEAMKLGGSCHNTDLTTAADADAAMREFFAEKFPELAGREFFITGESYAGVYVPTLAKHILDNNAKASQKINIKGIAVGDPCTSNEDQKDSMDMLWYGHKYGFVPEADFDLLWNECGRRYAHPLARGHWAAAGAISGAARKSRTPPQPDNASKSPECVAAERRFLLATSNAFSQEWKHAWMNDLTLYGPAAIVGFDAPGSLNWKMAQWMMRDDVRAALHVEHAPQKEWPGPTGGWTYTSDWAACNPDAKPGTPSMIDFYREIAPRLRTTLVFNGDTDPCVSYEGTRSAIIKVGFPERTGRSYRPWFFNATAASLALLQEKPLLFGPSLALRDAGAQFAGHVVDFAHNLTFATVHGSGHMVPQFRPRVALHMLRRVLSGEPFSPEMPDKTELEKMSDKQFAKLMDDWVEEAQSPAYLG